MRAVRIHGAGDLRVEVLPDPQIPPGKVLLAGGYTGICGNDLHLYYAPEAFPWDFSAPAPLTARRGRRSWDTNSPAKSWGWGMESTRSASVTESRCFRDTTAGRAWPASPAAT